MAEETDRGLPREVNSSSHRPHLNITHTVWVRRMIFVVKNEDENSLLSTDFLSQFVDFPTFRIFFPFFFPVFCLFKFFGNKFGSPGYANDCGPRYC